MRFPLLIYRLDSYCIRRDGLHANATKLVALVCVPFQRVLVIFYKTG